MQIKSFYKNCDYYLSNVPNWLITIPIIIGAMVAFTPMMICFVMCSLFYGTPNPYFHKPFIINLFILSMVCISLALLHDVGFSNALIDWFDISFIKVARGLNKFHVLMIAI